VGATRVERAIVPVGTTLKVGRSALRVLDGEVLRVPLYAQQELAGLKGCSAAMRRLMAEIERAAPSDVGVLVNGESGCGKELVANALHSLGMTPLVKTSGRS